MDKNDFPLIECKNS